MGHESETKSKLFDHSSERFIDIKDIIFVEKACGVLGNVKFKVQYREGEVYKNTVTVPEGLAWIKLKAFLPAGGNFDFVFQKANELKEQENK